MDGECVNTDFIKGVIVPIITPIDGDEKIDEAKFRAQIDYVIDGGMHGILVWGSNGEFYQNGSHPRSGTQMQI